MVHVVLVDPVPEARATAAKALGTLVERLGEVHFPDLVPGLLRTLKTDTSGVDRQGAAQGLSEVLAGLGMERMEGLLPDIIANAQSPRSTVREGFMSLLVFLPATFGARFQPHLPKIIPPILSGLSDSEDYVREAAMRAGRMIVTNYSSKAIDLLLPELERGMFDSGWRIRVGFHLLGYPQSSLTLCSNHPSRSWESCCSRCLVSAGKPRSKKTKRPRRLLWQNLLARRWWKSLVSSGAIVYSPRSISPVRMLSTSCASLPFISGRHWCTTHRGQVSCPTLLTISASLIVAVREILPELLSQIIQLLTSEEVDQQEASCPMCASLTVLVSRSSLDCKSYCHRTVPEVRRKGAVRDCVDLAHERQFSGFAQTRGRLSNAFRAHVRSSSSITASHSLTSS